ncbi:hypothetical protein Tco_0536339 [Tanacetum coccineum]
MLTETELALEQTQQGVSHELSIVIMDPVMQCTTLPSHSRISGNSLDDGLVPLMSNEEVLTLLKYVPRFKEIKVYVKAGVSLVEQHAMEVRSGHTNSVVIEEMVEYDWVNEVGKEEIFLLDNGENVGFIDYDDELFPKLSIKSMKEERKRMASDVSAFRNLLAKIDFELE